MNKKGNKYRNYWMRNNRYSNKAEFRLFNEVANNCIEGNAKILKSQYKVNLTTNDYGRHSCILDIAIPQLMIAIRVMGGVHGEPWCMNPKDTLQKELLELF